LAKDKEKESFKTFVRNKKAKFEYEILSKFEAGIVLSGPEVKAIRAGKASIADAHVRIKNKELYIKGLDITKYEQIGYADHDTLRDKKLLLHKHEIKKISTKITEKGLTLIPLSVYAKGSFIKLEMALVRGKKLHDRRADLKKKAEERSMDRKYKIR
jgi:SsrA-binding protein